MVYTEQGLAEIQHLDDCKPLYDTSVDLAGAGVSDYLRKPASRLRRPAASDGEF